jgi:hypothetical protein
VQILKEAFFFRCGDFYEIGGGQLKDEEERRKPEQEVSH